MQNATQNAEKLRIRFRMPDDMPNMLRIENCSFGENAWTEDAYEMRHLIGQPAGKYAPKNRIAGIGVD